jgi:hypothetical protein
MLKKEMMLIIQQNRPAFNAYATDEMAKAENKTTQRMPPYHRELKPTELIWGQIKNM